MTTFPWWGQMKANFIGLRRQAFLALLMSTVSFPANAQFVVDTEYNAQAGLAAIHADVAYNLGLSGQVVKVGIIDSGINPNHSEFSGAISASYDFIANSSVLTDADGHGSHVAGIIGARRDGVGMQGVAYNSSLIISRAIGSGGTFDKIASAIDFAVANGARVINNSWGLGFPSPAGDVPFYYFTKSELAAAIPTTITSLQNAVSAGAVIVFANGNGNLPPPRLGYDNPNLGGLPYYYPELQNNWITVAATDVNGAEPLYTNRCGVAANFCIAAPGGGDDEALTGIY